MLKKYIVYNKTTPFPGYIESGGKLRDDMPPDGSTVMERLAELPPDKGYALLDVSTDFPDPETHKWDEATEQMVTLEVGDVTPKVQAALDAAAKAQAMIDNLPSWAQVETAIDNATTIAALKIIIKKIARVVYWLAKNSDA